jgi:membrane-associated phospholipid phosphatase
MTHPPDTSSETFAGSAESRSTAFAKWLSIVFNPLFAGIAAYLVVGFYAPAGGANGPAWAGTALTLQVLPPLLFYIVQLRRGAFSDPDVSVREERNQLYLLGSASVLISLAVMALFGAPRPLVALSVGTLVLGVVCGLINLSWKISMHAAGMGSLATVALLYAGTLGLVLWALAALVGWARVRTRNHTPLQVLAGFFASTTVLSVAFAFLGQ